MADWTTIADTQVDPDAPVTSELGYAWRDNPIAIAEGASGAPRITHSALLAPVAGTAYTVLPYTNLNVTTASPTSTYVSRGVCIRGGVVTVTVTNNSGSTCQVSGGTPGYTVSAGTTDTRAVTIGAFQNLTFLTTLVGGSSATSTVRIQIGNDAPRVYV